jgi:hypothetical protein
MLLMPSAIVSLFYFCDVIPIADIEQGIKLENLSQQRKGWTKREQSRNQSRTAMGV